MIVWGRVLWALWTQANLGEATLPWVAENYLLFYVLWFCAVPLSWVPVEAVLMNAFGTTPGKWFFRFHVTRADGQRLSEGECFQRAVHLYWRGMGFGIVGIQYITWFASALHLEKRGRTSWDAKANLVVTHHRVGLLRWFGCVSFFLLASF
jgi:hypothetical protein